MKVSGSMRKIQTIPIFAVLVLITSFSVPQVFADPSVSPPSPTSGPVGTEVTTAGSGFDPAKAVYVFFNGVRVDSAGSGGTFSVFWPVPDVPPGTYSIQFSYDPNAPDNTLPSLQFEVKSPISIPDFPFSFSLVIMFVAVAGVYLAIRQKMTTSFFKPF